MVYALPEWLEPKVARTKDGCWRWMGRVSKDGYARGFHGTAHRVVYQRLVGSLPWGTALHHTCAHRDCVNPAHCAPMTRAEHDVAHGKKPAVKEAARGMRLTDDDVVVLEQKAARARLRWAIRLAGTTYAQLAAKAGLSRVHLASAANGRERLSVTAKLRVARALGIAPRVVWPALEALANELLHGAAGRRER